MPWTGPAPAEPLSPFIVPGSTSWFTKTGRVNAKTRPLAVRVPPPNRAWFEAVVNMARLYWPEGKALEHWQGKDQNKRLGQLSICLQGDFAWAISILRSKVVRRP
jgi:hypothetical protein